jgi:sorbitol-specific phosphotransferase system component IIC
MNAEPSRGIVETTGQVAQGVVTGLVGTPALLVIVVLNVIAIVGAGWFLSKVADNVAARTDRMMELIADCMKERHL